MVPRSDIGIASTTLSVLDNDPRNSQHTSAVKISARNSSSSISLTDSSMKMVVSASTSTFIPLGTLRWISATFSRIALVTATALVPRCFKTPSACSGSPSSCASVVTSSNPSSTSATSSRCTGASFTLRITSFLSASRSMASPSRRTLSCRWLVSSVPPGSSMCCFWMEPITSFTTMPRSFMRSVSSQMRMLRSR